METITSIANLKAGYSNLCVKVTTKSDVKTSAKDVKYGVIHVSDETGTVRATCFGDKTADILQLRSIKLKMCMLKMFQSSMSTIKNFPL
jgi:hypothetical protein